jgi:hypothetical protein
MKEMMITFFTQATNENRTKINTSEFGRLENDRTTAE